MRFEKRRLDLGRVSVVASNDGYQRVSLPGEYGTVVGLVATVEFYELEKTSAKFEDDFRLLWGLATSVDGETWIDLTTPGESALRNIGVRTADSVRLHGPVGDSLALTLAPQAGQGERFYNVDATWSSIAVVLGLQIF